MNKNFDGDDDGDDDDDDDDYILHICLLQTFLWYCNGSLVNKNNSMSLS